MIIALIVALFILTGLSVWLYFDKRKFFEKHKGFAEFLAVMVSLIFSLIAFQQTQSSIDQSTTDFNKLISKIDTIVSNVGSATNSVDSVKASLKYLPMQINAFANSIGSLNSSLSAEKKSIETTLNNLAQGVNDFHLSVEAMTERYNRKPMIVLDFKPIKKDSIFIIPSFVLKNEGTLEAELSSISFQIPNKNIVKFENEFFNTEEYTPEIKRFSRLYNDGLLVADPTKPLKIVGDMKFRLKPDFEIYLYVYYKASFGNGGTSDFVIVVKNGNIFLKHNSDPPRIMGF